MPARREAVTGEIDESAFSERELLAIRLADRFARDPHSIDDEFFAELQSEFSDDQIIDLCFACWIFSGGQAFNSALDLVPEQCTVET